MTPRQVALVQESFWALVPDANEAAAVFYQRLFDIDPTTRPLFAASNMPVQGRKLMETLGVVLVGLTRPETVVPAAEALARRHLAYGVQAPHYASVGAALLWMLEQRLGGRFTPEVAAAWQAAYALLSGVMLAADVVDEAQ